MELLEYSGCQIRKSHPSVAEFSRWGWPDTSKILSIPCIGEVRTHDGSLCRSMPSGAPPTTQTHERGHGQHYLCVMIPGNPGGDNESRQDPSCDNDWIFPDTYDSEKVLPCQLTRVKGSSTPSPFAPFWPKIPPYGQRLGRARGVRPNSGYPQFCTHVGGAWSERSSKGVYTKSNLPSQG
jgi:hypothetical protein